MRTLNSKLGTLKKKWKGEMRTFRPTLNSINEFSKLDSLFPPHLSLLATIYIFTGTNSGNKVAPKAL